MTVTSLERARMILTTLNYGLRIKEFNVEQNIEWMNQEDILQTMRKVNVVGRGMDKGKVLRPTLDALVGKFHYLERREPELKTQSRWEYRITDKGKIWLQQQQDMASIMKNV